MTFDGGLMSVERVATSPPVNDDLITARSFRCECLEQINDAADSYLIRHQLLSQPRRPTHPDSLLLTADGDESVVESMNVACLQFVRRSASVVQLRISSKTLKQRNRTLCDDAALRWEKWLIVDVAAMFQQSTGTARDLTREDDERHPLTGGFSVRVFDAESRDDQGVVTGHVVCGHAVMIT